MITPATRFAPLIITCPGSIPYALDKVVPWHYGADIYYHGVKQNLKAEEVNPDVGNIVGTNKITRSGRVFSPEISPKIFTNPIVISSSTPASTSDTIPVLTLTVTPADKSSGTRGKEVVGEPARTETPRKIVGETSKQEIEENLKIIKKSDYNVVEQLGQTPSKISMLSLLLML